MKKTPIYLTIMLGMILSACQEATPSSSFQSSEAIISTSTTIESSPSPSSSSFDATSVTSDEDSSSSDTTSWVSSASSEEQTSTSDGISTSSMDDSSVSETSTSSSTSTTSEAAYAGYYAALNGLSDAQLMGTLRPLLRQALGNDGLFPSTVTYQTAITALQEADQDPTNTNQVIIWYRMTSVNKTWDSGSTWNREHVWPQSLMAVDTSNSSRHKGADAHNLKPANPSDNTSRGNKYYAEVTNANSFSPPESIRGDIARILFYMVTMYPELSLVDVSSGSPAVYQMAQFSLMVKWHLQDPVDAFEARRNDVLHQHQGNRNPYIDHQELVCRMFRFQSVDATNACQA